MKTFSFLMSFAVIMLFGSFQVLAEQANYQPSSGGSSGVNHLIERYIDAAKGFTDAAEEVDDQGLKDTFLKKAEERRKFSEDLQKAMQAAGQKYEQSGSAEGAAHRAWIDLKSLITDKDDIAVLNAVRTGEEAAVKSYKEVFGEPLTKELRSSVQDQFDSVFDSYNWVVEEIKNRSKAEVAEEAKE